MLYMKKFEFALLTFALLAAPTFSRADEFSPIEGCLERYASAADSDVQAAGVFLSEAANDFDYPSMDQMALNIRAEKGLKSWSTVDFLDPLNVDISYALDLSRDKVCGEKLLGLAGVQELLVMEALPAYFQSNPSDAAEIDWK